MTSEAAELQTATIAKEAARASYAESTAAADSSEVDSALSAAQEAQSTLEDLMNSPTDAEIASATAAVATAQASLEELLNGADDSEVQELEISLEQTLIDLEQAYSDLEAADVVATVDGTVLSIEASVGQTVSEGSQVVLLADIGALELAVEVAEVDIYQVSIGQAAEIESDAFPGVTYAGEVSRVEPASDESSGVVSYPVIVRLSSSNDLDGVLPGMTAVATLTDTESEASAGWMMPITAIQTQGDMSVVNVTRGGSTVQVVVTPGTGLGEWTKVRSADLQTGDQVYASWVITVESEDGDQGGPGAGGLLGGAAGGSPPSGGPPGN